MSEQRKALARAVRELREGPPRLTHAEVAQVLGISRSYASELYRDPEGVGAAARRTRSRGACADCGKPTAWRTGGPAKRCNSCAGRHRTVWTAERVVEAFKSFHRIEGRVPSARDLRREEYLPSLSALQRIFGTLGAAQEAAGLERRPAFGERRHERGAV